jgi:hypothetical protein
VLWIVAMLTLSVCAPHAAFGENRWGSSKNPWANSQNSWGRTPSPKPGKPSNYSGYVAVPAGPIVDNPAMYNTIPDGLRSAPPPKKRKARRPKPPSETPAKKKD